MAGWGGRRQVGVSQLHLAGYQMRPNDRLAVSTCDEDHAGNVQLLLQALRRERLNTDDVVCLDEVAVQGERQRSGCENDPNGVAMPTPLGRIACTTGLCCAAADLLE